VLSVTEASVEIMDVAYGHTILLIEMPQKHQRKGQQNENQMIVIMTDPASSDDDEEKDLEN